MKRKEKKEDGVKFPRRDESWARKGPFLLLQGQRGREREERNERRKQDTKWNAEWKKENVDGKVRGLKKDGEEERLVRKDFSKDP